MLSGRKILGAGAPIYGHTVPVLSLSLGLQRAGNDVRMVSFDDRTRGLCSRYGLRTTPFEMRANDPVRNLLTARRLLEAHRPEVTICDWSRALWLGLQAWRPACRVSVLRCELLIGHRRRNPALPAMFPFETDGALDALNDALAQVGLAGVGDWRDICRADVIVVPSIPQIDPLPDTVHDDYPESTFVYTGPLLLPIGTPASAALRDWIASFRQNGTPVLLVTLGTAWETTMYRTLADCLERTEFAVVMVVPDDRLRRELRDGPRLQVVGLTDLRDLAAQVDVVVHHCGHGTLHTALLAGKPSLTLPSGHYDREDNALRLQDLDCGRHLDAAVLRKGVDAEAFSAVVTELLTSTAIEKGVAAMTSIVAQYVDTRGPAELARVLAAHPTLSQADTDTS
jgi:UDP:flavonoid glycosyltransferase YjiC (YdhE family)